MFNMLNKPNNVFKVIRVGGSLSIMLTEYLEDLGVKEGDFVIINSDVQLRALSETKIITIEKYRGAKNE